MWAAILFGSHGQQICQLDQKPLSRWGISCQQQLIRHQLQLMKHIWSHTGTENVRFLNPHESLSTQAWLHPHVPSLSSFDQIMRSSVISNLGAPNGLFTWPMMHEICLKASPSVYRVSCFNYGVNKLWVMQGLQKSTWILCHESDNRERLSDHPQSCRHLASGTLAFRPQDA